MIKKMYIYAPFFSITGMYKSILILIGIYSCKKCDYFHIFYSLDNFIICVLICNKIIFVAM